LADSANTPSVSTTNKMDTRIGATPRRFLAILRKVYTPVNKRFGEPSITCIS
jgi:hypothetical protein